MNELPVNELGDGNAPGHDVPVDASFATGSAAALIGDEVTDLSGDVPLERSRASAADVPIRYKGETAADSALVDLHGFFRAVGGARASTATTTSPEPRVDTTADVTVLDDGVAVEVSGPALEAAGWVDGIQASMVIAWRAHRPVLLVYLAAAAVRGWGDPVAVAEELSLFASPLDEEWAAGVGAGAAGDGTGTAIPVTVVGAITPPDVEVAAAKLVGERRASLERHLIAKVVADGHTPLVVDGDLRARVVRDGIVGVAKTTRTRYLPDESVLYGMRSGFRSPRFKIATSNSTDRYSCYLRLHDAGGAGWNHGLVRLEAFDPDLLEPLAVLAMESRQGAGSGDGRWDRHLAPVRATEEYLRARRPPVFGLRA